MIDINTCGLTGDRMSSSSFFDFVLGDNDLQLSNMSVVPHANFFPCGYVFNVVGHHRMPLI